MELPVNALSHLQTTTHVNQHSKTGCVVAKAVNTGGTIDSNIALHCNTISHKFPISNPKQKQNIVCELIILDHWVFLFWGAVRKYFNCCQSFS